ncbi:MAG TPA: PDZ domain-containing protein, partial [Chthonomonadales bacterium]|nr:PDZ domain-containing protein [Chthonomonadales bacterium]
MPIQGYYRHPAIHRNSVVFVSEDDLWLVSGDGGVARRLTANRGAISFPSFSPNGSTLAFTGREEGHSEVYTMPADGGPVTRVTYLGASSNVAGWMPDNSRILFSSDAGRPFNHLGVIYEVRSTGGDPSAWSLGPALSVSVASGGRVALGRNSIDPARWKRYRGGTAGDIWVDAEGNGQFHRLIRLNGNLVRPMWLDDRIFFVSDHDGVANIYSTNPDGEDLRQHTHHRDFFARYPSTDGSRIVYHAGADLYVLDPADDTVHKIEVDYYSPRVNLQRRFISAARYLESYAPHPAGHSLSITARGKSFTFAAWEGAVSQQAGEASAERRRLTRWLNDGQRVLTVVDDGGDQALEIRKAGESSEPPTRVNGDIGRVYAIRVSPQRDQVVLTNHRNELIYANLESGEVKVLDKSPFGHIQGIDWSPDGRWVAYGFPLTRYTTAIRLWDQNTGEISDVTEPVLHDFEPVFDPSGRYLYFLGIRELNPVYDRLHFDLGFPRGTRIYLVTLRKDVPNPFMPEARTLFDWRGSEPKAEEQTKEAESGGTESKEEEKDQEAVSIDLAGISRRIVAFPVPEGIYAGLAAMKGKVLFVSYPIEGALHQELVSREPSARGSLESYDMKELKQESLISKVTDFQLAGDRKTLAYRSANRLRIVKAGEKTDDKAGTEAGRKTGWIDLGRVRISLEPGVEWRQMAREAWTLQREYFWTEDMSRIDWDAVWERYSPLLERVGARGEFSDLMWEMQGELGTSHAYEFGGDYRPEPDYPQGFLGADISFEPESVKYVITRVVQGAPGEERADSPLNGPAVGVQAGARLLAVNGRKLSRDYSPAQALVHQADLEVRLEIEEQEGASRIVTVKALRSEFPARYREWVESNRRTVHEETGGQIGYVHIPDMGAAGYAEFH